MDLEGRTSRRLDKQCKRVDRGAVQPNGRSVSALHGFK